MRRILLTMLLVLCSLAEISQVRIAQARALTRTGRSGWSCPIRPAGRRMRWHARSGRK